MFPQQPVADITGKFGLTQAQEIKFEHAFDLPMTTASVAMQFRMAAGKRWLSDFSLRRNGDIERAVRYCDLCIHRRLLTTLRTWRPRTVWTYRRSHRAHYWQQAYLGYLYEPEIEPRTGQPKHFEQVAFRTLARCKSKRHHSFAGHDLMFTWARLHAAMAATSNETRRRAFKGFRVDSGDLAELGKWCLRFFEANGLEGLRPNLTGDSGCRESEAHRRGVSRSCRLWHRHQTFE